MQDRSSHDVILATIVVAPKSPFSRSVLEGGYYSSEPFSRSVLEGGYYSSEPTSYQNTNINGFVACKLEPCMGLKFVAGPCRARAWPGKARLFIHVLRSLPF